MSEAFIEWRVLGSALWFIRSPRWWSTGVHGAFLPYTTTFGEPLHTTARCVLPIWNSRSSFQRSSSTIHVIYIFLQLWCNYWHARSNLLPFPDGSSAPYGLFLHSLRLSHVLSACLSLSILFIRLFSSYFPLLWLSYKTLCSLSLSSYLCVIFIRL